MAFLKTLLSTPAAIGKGIKTFLFGIPAGEYAPAAIYEPDEVTVPEIFFGGGQNFWQSGTPSAEFPADSYAEKPAVIRMMGTKWKEPYPVARSRVVYEDGSFVLPDGGAS